MCNSPENPDCQDKWQKGSTPLCKRKDEEMEMEREMEMIPLELDNTNIPSIKVIKCMNVFTIKFHATKFTGRLAIFD